MKKYLPLILFSILFLSACTKKTTSTISPTPTPKLVEMPIEDRPNISLTPRADGHELTLNINSIKNNLRKIEYELTYIASDNNLEIEKGASGTIEETDLNSGKIDRKILLGTESCTSGCKYKYDNGVSGGNLVITFFTQNGQLSTFETPFILRSGVNIKKTGKLIWSEENYTYTPVKLSTSGYYVAQKDYKNGGYIVTSSIAP